MTHYDYLKKFEQEGMMKVLFSLGLDPSRTRWLELYEYHLTHPEVAQWKVALQFNFSRGTVQKIYEYMQTDILEPKGRP